MTRHVREQLLEDPEDSRRALLVRIGEAGRDLHVAADARATLELASLPFDRRVQPDLVEHLGTQARADAAYGVDDAIDRLVHALRLRRKALRRIRARFQERGDVV